ncbi:MAG TPA: STAS/SEC14 domain-containing protein [Thermoleophilia bacterium]|nr:STAS/SEC14 domain-containing protein [Thermoleophilia bacterium]
MIEVIPEAPAGVLAFMAVGEVRPDEYREVVKPAIDTEVAAGHKLRIVVILDDSVTNGADRKSWEDVGPGLSFLRRVKRVALVTDQAWVTAQTARFGWLLARRLRVFPGAEVAAAMAWAAA